MKKISLNRALAAKKKFYLTLLSALLLSSAAMADDVLFKMVSTPAVPDSSVAAGATLTLSADNNFFFYTEGSAEVYAKADGNPQKVLTNHCVRIINKNYAYIKITLKEGETLQPGDVIELRGYESSTNDTCFFVYNESGSAGRKETHKLIKENNVASYTIKAEDVLKDANSFYINYGNAVTYVTAVTVSRPTNLVKFYSFDGLTPADFETDTKTGNVIVEGELYLNSDGATGSGANGIKAASSNKPQALYSRGANENRAIMLKVTDPCTVEIWAWSSQKDLSINEGKYASSTATKIITGTAAAANVIQKGTYNYTGLEDTKTLYTVPTGGFYVTAIRVTYAKIRPAADLAVTPSALTVRTNTKENFIISTSSNVTIKRDKTNDSNKDAVKFSGLNLDNPSGDINGTVEGKIAGTYVMTLTQPASADYRAGYAELTITIANEVDRNVAIATNTGTITNDDNEHPENGGKIWTSTDGNITMIGGDNSTQLIRSTDKLTNGFTLNKGKSYTISVPTNKTIKKVTFYAYTNAYGDKEGATKAKIQVNSVKSADLNYIREKQDDASTANEPSEIVYDDVNEKSFTFTISTASVAAKMDLVIEEASSYPVTVASGWATFYNHDDFVQMPAGMKAYYATSCNGSEILLSEVVGQVIRPDRAVVLAGTDGAEALQIISNPGSNNYENFSSAFSGTSKRTALPSGTIYCLNGSEGAFQLYNGAYIPANKAYYRYTGANNAPARFGMRIVEHENTTTAIENTEFVPIDYSAPIYNLQGQQVQVTESGIYIQNGRKYLIMK